MASTEGLIPITRAFLAKFYEKYPFDPLDSALDRLDSELQSQSEKLAAARTEVDESNDVFKLLDADVPHKIDENLWKNREQLEEIIYLLERDRLPDAVKSEGNSSSKSVADNASNWIEKSSTQLRHIVEYQKFTSEKVFEMVLTYMPQDLRGSLVRMQRERSERRRQGEVEALLQQGGTIQQKYRLLWQQQMDRRQTLASLGSASGVYKTLVQYLVGVPQVLLDFVKQINDHNGPMEEQRDRYGPHLYRLSSFVRKLRVFLTLWWEVYDTQLESTSAFVSLVSESVEVYSREFSRLLALLSEIFQNAPFLISAEDAMSAEDKSKIEAFKEVVVGFGSKFEVPLEVEAEDSVVAWEFSLTYGKDVGFNVDFKSKDGTTTGIVPYQRIESHEETFNAPGVGKYTLSWDNTYSYLTSKTVRYKVEVMPPVITEEQLEAEEALSHPN